MSAVLHLTGGGTGTRAADSTNRNSPGSGNGNTTPTDAGCQATTRSAGVASRLLMRIITNNTTSGTSTLVTRINGATANQTVSAGTGVTGEIEDVTHTDTWAAGDVINQLLTVGSGGTLVITMQRQLFLGNGGTGERYAAGVMTLSTTAFTRLCGPALVATETDTQTTCKAAGVWSALNLNVSGSTSNATATITNRIGAADGTMTLSITAATTGQFVDTTHSDAVVVGNLLNYKGAYGGTGSVIATWFSELTTQTTGATILRGFPTGGAPAGAVFAASATSYETTKGGASALATGTESSAQVKAGVPSLTSQHECIVPVNTVTANSTLQYRKNGANGNGLITITGLTTGTFQDTTHTDALVATDESAWLLTVGAGGTSLTLKAIVSLVVGSIPMLADHYYRTRRAA